MESNRTKEIQVESRQTTGHRPSIWNAQHIMSLETPYSHENHGHRMEELKEECRKLVVSTKEPHQQLDLIDKMQRLGVAKHFQKEVKDILAEFVHANYIPSNLYIAALQFRLLRQNGFSVTEDVFNKFMNGDGKFNQSLCEDAIGILSLYEASHFGLPDEDILDEALNFSTKHLLVLKEKVQNDMAEKIRQSLDYPLHWRMSWTEARDFILIYQRDQNMNSVLLQFAKLNYNISQSVYLKEVQELVGWWEDLTLKQKLPFARDRLLESYFMAIGTTPELQFSKTRKNIAKYTHLVTELDDIYEIHGSLNELEKYTKVIESWDLKFEEELPEYMKACFEAIYDHVSEMAQDALTVHGVDIVPYLKEQWITFAKAHIKEARWSRSGYLLSAEDFIQNGWMSIGMCPILVYAILGVAGRSINEYLSEFVEHWYESELFYVPSRISRLINDIQSGKDEMERGQNMNYIYYYMIQEGVSEEEAQNCTRGLIRKLWKMFNKIIMEYSCRAPDVINIVAGSTRCIHRIYQYHDWWGIQHNENNDCMKSILKPIPM